VPDSSNRSNRDQNRRVKGSARPIKAEHTTTLVDTAAKSERLETKPLVVRGARQLVTVLFSGWASLSQRITSSLGWYPRVEPYVGYGTDAYSRLICRTVYAPVSRPMSQLTRGIRSVFMVPAPQTQVRITIDGTPLHTVQLGQSELYDPFDPKRDQAADFAVSDSHGYLDLVAQGENSEGVHNVSYRVRGREAVHAPLFTIPSSAKVGVISDLDDTIIVTDVPRLLSAVVNMLFRNPRHRKAVPGMSTFYMRLHHELPDAPFFYLSTSPWNVETALRHFIRAHGFPEGPLLLRDFDPRPKTFIPSGVQHKLEFCEQLMADFPDMRFILIGDDGQHDPQTYAEVAKRYPGRVIAIGIRQLEPKESMLVRGHVPVPPMPEVNVPVFYGSTGLNLMKTLLPYLQRLNLKNRVHGDYRAQSNNPKK
jgi:phosphatidate phosphatase APP1